MLLRHPVLRAAAVSGCTMAAGDVLCQAIRARQAGRDIRIDWRQTARFGTVGLTLHGPFFYHGFRFLDARFGASVDLKMATIKACAGNFTIFPLYLGSFFLYMGLLEGLTPPQAVQKLRQAFVPTYTAGWGFWLPANLVNFVFVPPTGRVLFANAAGLIWNAILSLENSTKGRVATQPAAAAGQHAQRSGSGAKR